MSIQSIRGDFFPAAGKHSHEILWVSIFYMLFLTLEIRQSVSNILRGRMLVMMLSTFNVELY